MGKVLAPLFIPTTNRASEESRVESKKQATGKGRILEFAYFTKIYFVSIEYIIVDCLGLLSQFTFCN